MDLETRRRARTGKGDAGQEPVRPAGRIVVDMGLANRNTPRKLVWRAEIVLATADGRGTFEIMRRAKTSKPTVWRWQARYFDEGVAGLKRDKTRPSRVPPLPMETRLKVAVGHVLTCLVPGAAKKLRQTYLENAFPSVQVQRIC